MGLMDRWLGFIIRGVGFIFGGWVSFLEVWVSWINGWVSFLVVWVAGFHCSLVRWLWFLWVSGGGVGGGVGRGGGLGCVWLDGSELAWWRQWAVWVIY